MIKDNYYKVGISPIKITKEDREKGEVIAKFHKQAISGNTLLEDKMFYMIVNEKPKNMSQKEWEKIVKTVLRVEIVQKYPKFTSFGFAE